MATLLITNLSSGVVNLGDFYTSLAVGASISVDRRPGEIPLLSALMASLSAGDVSMSVTYTADEIASGLQSPDKAVEARDMAPGVAGGDGLDPGILMKFDVPVGGGGADEVTLIAAGALPYPFQVCDVWANISTAAAGSWVLGDEAGGAGTDIATLDSTTTGVRVPSTAPLTSIAVALGAAKGLFLARSDSTAVGEVFALVKRTV
jgi:hypothetical protein